MYTIKRFFTFALFYIIAFSASDALMSNKIGVNYGQLGNNLPSPYQSIELLKSMQVGRVKLYDANPEILHLLSRTNIQVSIMVKNEEISSIASNQSVAQRWVRTNVLAYYPGTKVRFILVGNEVFSYNDMRMWLDLVPAMRRIKKALNGHGIRNIKVGTPVAMDVMEKTFPPSSGTFRPDLVSHIMPSLLKFLNGTKSFFFVDVYPYFTWSEDPRNVDLDFALFDCGNRTYTDQESGLFYDNLLDQMLDSVTFAMRKLGYDGVMLAIAETGWPNGGDIDQLGANIRNAATYNRNLIRKMTAYPALGTPANRGLVIPMFVFSLYDENRKPGPGTERHWGLFRPNGTPVYEVDLTGTRLLTDYPPLPEPTNNKLYKGKIWCVVARSAYLTDLGRVLDSVCSNGTTTCDELAPGKSCYQPISVAAHASYAFSSYWAKFRATGTPCYFNGLAVQTTVDPSHGSCKFPSVSL